MSKYIGAWQYIYICYALPVIVTYPYKRLFSCCAFQEMSDFEKYWLTVVKSI